MLHHDLSGTTSTGPVAHRLPEYRHNSTDKPGAAVTGSAVRASHCSWVTAHSHTETLHTGKLPHPETSYWGQTPLLPPHSPLDLGHTPRVPSHPPPTAGPWVLSERPGATSPGSSPHGLPAARSAGTGVAERRANPAHPGPRTGLTLSLRRHAEHGGFPVQPSWSFLRQKQREQWTPTSRAQPRASPRCRWEEGPGDLSLPAPQWVRPRPRLQGADDRASGTWAPADSPPQRQPGVPPVSSFAHSGPWERVQDGPAFEGTGCMELGPLYQVAETPSLSPPAWPQPLALLHQCLSPGRFS